MGGRKLTLTVWEAMVKVKAAVTENIGVSRVRLSRGVSEDVGRGFEQTSFGNQRVARTNEYDGSCADLPADHSQRGDG